MNTFDEKLKEQIELRCSDAIYNRSIPPQAPKFFLSIDESMGDREEFEADVITVSGDDEEKGKCFLCKSCTQDLKKGIFPAKSAANSLRAVPVPKELELTSYLEEALVARTLLFMKIFSLKSSLMPAVKDKTVVIPLQEVDILNTIGNLPRLPSESGILYLSIQF